MRKLLILVMAIGALAGVGDRVAVVAAERQIALAAQEKFELDDPPKVNVRGFPFLTQALDGRFDQIDLEARTAQFEGLTLERFFVSLYVVTVDPKGLAMVKKVDRVKVDLGRVRVEVSEGPFNDYLSKSHTGIEVRFVENGFEASSTVEVAGTKIPLEIRGTVTLVGDALSFKATEIRSGGKDAPGAIQEQALRRFTFTQRMPRLPANITLTGLEISQGSLAVLGE
ncbi:MAG: DUF2993 domain-containing protein, partial [Actinomycetota bacterium]